MYCEITKILLKSKRWACYKFVKICFFEVKVGDDLIFFQI